MGAPCFYYIFYHNLQMPTSIIISATRNHIQNFLSEHDNHAAEEGQKAVCPLAGVMALQREANLHDAETQNDDADRADHGEDEVREVVHHLQRVIGINGNGGK